MNYPSPAGLMFIALSTVIGALAGSWMIGLAIGLAIVLLAMLIPDY